MNPLPSIFSLGSKSRSRRATVEDYHDVTASQPANLSVHAAHVISPSSSCYSDDAPTPVIGPGYVPSGGQMYETFSPSSSSSEPLPIRAPEHYADHMHLPEEVDRDELDSQHDYDDTPRAIPVEVLNSTTSSDSRRRVTFLGHLTDPMDDRRTNTSSSSSSGSSMPRNVRGILKSPRPFTEQRLYNGSVPSVIRSGGGSDYSTSTTSSVSTRRALGKLLDKENIVPRDYSRNGGLPMQDMYFVIPGNAPVIFQDEDGNEIYRVDAVKPGRRSRRRKYIFQDEFGNELCRVGDFGDENSSSYSGSVRGNRSNSSSVSSSSSSRSLSAKMVYLGSDGSVTTKSASSSFSDVSSSSGRSYDGYRQSDRDKYRRDERPRRDDHRRDDRYERDDRYRRDDYNRDDGYSNYTRGTGSRRQVPDIYLVDEEGRLVDERSTPRRSSSRRRDDDYSDDMYDERDYV